MKIESTNFIKINEWVIYVSEINQNLKINSIVYQNDDKWQVLAVNDSNLYHIKIIHVRCLGHEKRPDIGKVLELLDIYE